MLSYERLGLH